MEANHINRKSRKNKLLAYANIPIVVITISLTIANSLGNVDKVHRTRTRTLAMQAVAAINDDKC